MPDGESASFVPVLERFEDGSVSGVLAERPSIELLEKTLGLPDLTVREERPLAFRCRCSRERAPASLTALSKEELEAMIAATSPRSVTCHMCGEDYAFQPDELWDILTQQDRI